MLQGAESGAGATGEGGGPQAATTGGGLISITGEIGDEDSKTRSGGDLGGDELGDGGDRGLLGGGSGGNRWPRQETLALLEIRSDMDAIFRDSSLKGPLWEEVSRKMADLGYNRSSKKCKEKFENVYKYHRRTKEGRAGKSDGKTYRFFDQLQALETHSMHPPPAQDALRMTEPIQPPSIPPHVTVTSTNSIVGQKSQPSLQPGNPASLTISPSSSSSDEEIHGMRRKRKRNWKGFFERLMKRMIGKQEDLHQKFLVAIEKREQDRMVKEEAWKVREISRLNREHEILVQERSMAAAKDAALLSLIQKLSNQKQIPPLPPPPRISPPVNQPQPQPRTPIQTPTPALTSVQTQIPAPREPKNTNSTSIVHVSDQQHQLELTPTTEMANSGDRRDGNIPAASPSRWPKKEVEALIKLRTILEQRYQETGPKGPLWEEISSEMKKIGYNRNAKRCKEKWENINKYFKKVKESNKKRPEDSKICPYFHQLDALYRRKNKVEPLGGYSAASAPVDAMAAPIVVQPEQHWDEEEEEDDVDEDEENGFEIVASTYNGGSVGGAPAAAS